jgi:hypothetical protein
MVGARTPLDRGRLPGPGDRSGARKALDRCRAMLEELDVEPEPKTLVLERRLTGELSRTS